MKSFLLFLTFLFVSFSIHAQEFQFEKETIDYGKVAKKSDGHVFFIYKHWLQRPSLSKEYNLLVVVRFLKNQKHPLCLEQREK